SLSSSSSISPATYAPSLLSLHDALPIYSPPRGGRGGKAHGRAQAALGDSLEPGGQRREVWPRRRLCRHNDGDAGGYAAAQGAGRDRKSTRLNSSHVSISYAVFCLKKKKR